VGNRGEEKYESVLVRKPEGSHKTKIDVFMRTEYRI
jgi:hypothetical protein